jgi:putative phosphoribosyl transferase
MTVAYHSAQIPAAGVVLEADIVVPQQARGLVLFAHGSGSSRFSPRNRYVAGQFQHAGLATVLADLLTPAEEQADARTGQMRFDIGLLAVRLTALGDWLAGQEATAALVLGLFGASTGAAAALVAAAARPAQVRAVVSRGGRPDLAAQVLPRVHQPVLLIVGEKDPAVLELNRQAMQKLAGETELVIVPGASHLFEEPGALEHVAQLARDWFLEHLT